MAWTSPRTWTTGEVVTASIMNTHVRDNLSYLHDTGPALTYANYTPTLTASTSNPTLGSGSVQNGRYTQIGKTVHYYGRIIFGTSGVAAGSGNYRVSLPVNWAAQIGDDTCGEAWLFDASASAQANVICRFNATNATFFEMWYPQTWYAGTWLVVSDTNPWSGAWAASDELHFAVTYESV